MTMKMISDNVDYKVDKNQALGLCEATLSIALPTISVTRYKADRSDLKYEMRRAVEEIVGEIVEKALDDE